MSSSLHINDEMSAFDRKDRAYYDNFTDEDRKKFSTYLMLKYGANVVRTYRKTDTFWTKMLFVTSFKNSLA